MIRRVLLFACLLAGCGSSSTDTATADAPGKTLPGPAALSCTEKGTLSGGVSWSPAEAEVTGCGSHYTPGDPVVEFYFPIADARYTLQLRMQTRFPDGPTADVQTHVQLNTFPDTTKSWVGFCEVTLSKFEKAFSESMPDPDTGRPPAPGMNIVGTVVCPEPLTPGVRNDAPAVLVSALTFQGFARVLPKSSK
jgi:hypothetical protein